MSFIRLLLIGLLAFFLIRIVRTVVKIVTTRRSEEDEESASSPREKGAPRKWTDIRDAEFEDLTPPPPKADGAPGGEKR